MTAIVQEPPEGKFRAIDRSLTLACVVDELANDREICIHGCSRSDLWQLEILSEPCGYDLVFVPAVNLTTGSVYFTRKPRGVLDEVRTAVWRRVIEHATRFRAQRPAGACRTGA